MAVGDTVPQDPTNPPYHPGPKARRGPIPWVSALRSIALAATGVGVALLGVSAYAALRMASRRLSYGRGAPPKGSFEQVAFPSADGLRLSGWLLPAADARDALILCHGFKTGRREMLPLAMALRERGHQVLLFDFRGHGKSEGRWSACGGLESRDLEGAVRFMKGRFGMEGLPIGVIGFSMGGAVAIMAAGRLPEIEAVVADSAFATLDEALKTGFCTFCHLPREPFSRFALWFGERLVGVRAEEVRPLDAVPDLSPRPLLIVHGTQDRIVPLSEAYLLYEAAGNPKELWVVARAGHVEARLLQFDAYLEKVDGFLKSRLARIAEAAQPQPISAGSSQS